MKKSFVVLLVSIFLSLGFHFYLMNQHYQLKLGLSSGSVCNVSATFNCDAVAASQYSQAFGIPVALLGLIAHLIFLILAVASEFSLSQHSEAIRRLLFWYSALIAGVSIVMGSISTFLLGTFCLFCMATYLLSWIELAATWKLQTDKPTETLSKDISLIFSQARWVLVLFISVPAISWLGNQIIKDNYGISKLEASIQDEILFWNQSPIQNFSEKGLIQQSANSSSEKVVLVEFADFLCPHCKVASTTLEAFASSHPDIQFIFKAFPLDKKCNKGLDHEGDGVRCQLAGAAFCAEQMNKTGWKTHHWIFEHQEKFYMGYEIATAIQDIAKETGNNPEEFKKCIESDSTYDLIQAVAAEGVAAKIQGTPSIFINGRRVQKGQALPILQSIYNSLKRN